MNRGINNTDIGNFILALEDYKMLPNCLTQLSNSEDPEKVKEFAKKYTDSRGIIDQYHQWNNINVHIVNQSWGSTSCGWGGMGGCAMTDSYTIVIENRFLEAVFVYYESRLVYIASMDNNYDKYKANLDRIPAFYDVKNSGLNVIYKLKR